jgi:hypothetical protein
LLRKIERFKVKDQQQKTELGGTEYSDITLNVFLFSSVAGKEFEQGADTGAFHQIRPPGWL